MAASSFRTKIARAFLCYVVLVGSTAVAYRLVNEDTLPAVHAVYLAHSAVLGAGGLPGANASAATLIVTMVALIAGFTLRVYVFAAVTAHIMARLLQADQTASPRGFLGVSKPFRVFNYRWTRNLS